MSSILAVVAGTPPALEGRSLFRPGIVLERWADAERALRRCGGRLFDLIVVAGFPGEHLSEVATKLRRHPRWRGVPVLYLLRPDEPGFVVPATFRPESDCLLKADFSSPAAARRMEELAQSRGASDRLIVVGATELDPARGRLRHGEAEVRLTRREAELLAALLRSPRHAISSAELARSLGRAGGRSDFQVVRRHVSNLRRKLAEAEVPLAVRTVRGTGYALELPRVG